MKVDEPFVMDLLNLVSEAIICTDLRGKVTMWNSAAVAIFGYTSSEMIDQQTSVLFPSNQQQQIAEIASKIASNEIFRCSESVRLHKCGKIIEVSVVATALKHADGNIFGIAEVIRDISAQVHFHFIFDNFPRNTYFN